MKYDTDWEQRKKEEQKRNETGGAYNLLGSALTYSTVTGWATRVQVLARGSFPILSPLSPTSFPVNIYCPILIKGNNAKNKYLEMKWHEKKREEIKDELKMTKDKMRREENVMRGGWREEERKVSCKRGRLKLPWDSLH